MRILPAALYFFLLGNTNGFAPKAPFGLGRGSALQMAASSEKEVRSAINNINENNFEDTLTNIESFLRDDADAKFYAKAKLRLSDKAWALGLSVPDGFAKTVPITEENIAEVASDVEEEATEQPAVEEEIPEPVMEEETPETVADKEIPVPVSEETSEPAEEEISEPVAEEAPEPVAEEEAPAPVAEEETPEPVAEEETPAPVAEEETPEPVAEETPEPVAEEEKPEPVAEEKIQEPVAEKEVVVEETPEPVTSEQTQEPEPVAEEPAPELVEKMEGVAAPAAEPKKITPSLIKELRDLTGAGMMDCKKALTETNGDVDLAIENMRKSGALKAAKKATKVAAEGQIIVKEKEGTAALVEVNCQTDFVAKDETFLAFANEVAEYAAETKASVEDLQAKFEEKRVALVAKIGENINIRRAQYVEGGKVATYLHNGGKIGVVVTGDGEESVLKNLCMHVCASAPQFLTPDDVPQDVVEKERKVQIEIAMNEGKPQDIAEKMVNGRMKKYTGEVSLTSQPFVMEPKKSVEQVLSENGTTVSGFVRLQVGEGIEKSEEPSFADEVAAMAGGK